MSNNFKHGVWPTFEKDEIDAVINVLKSHKPNYLIGNKGNEFERKFSTYIGVKHGVALSSATVALEIALKSLKLEKKSEIIVTPRSFIASASSVVRVGLIPIFADIDINSHNINLENIIKKISKKTKAIICVHLADFPCDMIEIKKFAFKKNIKIIEDCSQAHGAKINNKLVGSFGDISCWSFCNDKIISTGGEGGMITTNSKKYYDYIWSYKDHGKNKKKYENNKKEFNFKYIHDFFGSNYRMTEMQAAIGIKQLSKLENWIIIRNKFATLINRALDDFVYVNYQRVPNNYVHSYYRYYLSLNVKFLKKEWTIKKIIQFLNKKYVVAGTGSCPEIYMEKSFKNKQVNVKKRLTNANKIGKNSIALNIHHYMYHNEIKELIKNLKRVFKQAFI